MSKIKKLNLLIPPPVKNNITPNKGRSARLVFLFMILFAIAANAQLTGTKTIPGNYASLALAITDLNTQGVGAGGVIINLNQAETAPAGGYVIGGAGGAALLTGGASSSAARPVVINGNSNIVTAFNPQASGALNDAIIKLKGADWITISGFVLNENGANATLAVATNNMTEWAVAMVYNSTTDGCQNNTIQGNTIQLNRLYGNSFGIYSSAEHIDGPTNANVTTAADIANNTTGPFINNKVYTNIISNVNFGIYFLGASTAANFDTGNDIGGSSAVTANTFSNWGGLARLSAYVNTTGNNTCIGMVNQGGYNCSYNVINATALTPAVSEFGILQNYLAQPTGTFTNTISNNNVAITSNPTVAAGAITAINVNQTNWTALLSTATITVHNNTITGTLGGAVAAATGSFLAISTICPAGTVNLTNNTIQNVTISFSNPNTSFFQGITSGATVAGGTVNIKNNQVINNSKTGTNSFTGITNSAACVILNIRNNTIKGNTHSGTVGVFNGIANSGVVTGAININSNQLGTGTGVNGAINLTSSSTGQIAAIINTGGGAACATAIDTNNVIGISWAGGTTGNFFGIVNVSACSTLEMKENVLRNMSSTATTAGFNAINNQGAVVNSVTLSNNQLGNATGGIVTLNSVTSGTFTGIANTAGAATCTVTINSNNFQGVNYVPVSTGSFQCISSTAAVLSEAMINNNFNDLTVKTSASVLGFFIGCSNATPTVTISGNFTTTQFTNNNATANVNFIGIYNAGLATTGTSTVSSNVFSNITMKVSNIGSMIYYLPGSGIGCTHNITANNNNISLVSNVNPGAGSLYPMNIGAGNVNVISNNSISAITGTAQTIGLLCGAVSTNTTTGSFAVRNNTVFNINSSATVSQTQGMQVAAGPTQNIFRNKIYDINCTGTGSAIGLLESQATAGTTSNIYNNIIGRVYANSSTVTNAVTGISASSTVANTTNLYYNTVYLDGSCPRSSYAMFANSSLAIIRINNNIFENNVTASGGASFPSLAMYRFALNASYLTASDNNIFYAGTPGTANLIWGEGTLTALSNTKQTLSLFKAYVLSGGLREVNSQTELSPFANVITGSAANYLKITGTSNSYAESGGTDLSAFTTDDYATNAIRTGYIPPQVGQANGGGYFPDMGAFEYDGTPYIDMSANTFLVPLNLAYYTPGSVFSPQASFTNNGGIPASGIPVHYEIYDPGNFLVYSNIQTITGPLSGTTNVTFTAIGGGVLSTQGTYTIKAYSAYPGDLVPANDMITGTITVINQLCGTYHVGSAQPSPFNTITNAVGAVNGVGVSCATTFLLDDATYGSETFPITINAYTGSSGVNTVTIKPNAATTPTITGAPTSAMFHIQGSNVIIDGSNNGSTSRDLTLLNSGANGVIRIQNPTVASITNDVVKNCNLINGNINFSQVVYIASGVTFGNPGNFTNIIIQNNSLEKAQFGVYCNATVAGGNGNGVNISDNSLNTAGANALRFIGIYLQGVDGGTVSNNTIGNFDAATTEYDEGIWFATGTVNSTISGNTISNLTFVGGADAYPVGIEITSGVAASNNTISGNTISGLTSGGTTIGASVCGIAVDLTGTGGVVIKNNKISNIKSTNAGGYGATGIWLSSTLTNANIGVYSNFLWDIAARGFAGATVEDNGNGIVIDQGGGYKVYYNTVRMNTNQTTNVAGALPAALLVTSGVTTAGSLDIRNNIFSNEQTANSTEHYSVYCGAANTVFLNINYNDYWFPTGLNLGFIGGSSKLNLAAWQAPAGTNQDVNSKSVQPLFITPFTDPHLRTDANCDFDGTAVNIALVTDDNDGDIRASGTVPFDIGADEFNSTFAVDGGPNQSPVCTSTLMAASAIPTGGTGTWSVFSGNGTFSLPGVNSPTATVSGLDQGPNVFSWVVISGSCIGSDNVTITRPLDAIATAGGSAISCENGSVIVSGASSANGTINWTSDGFGGLTGAGTLTPTYTPNSSDAGNIVTLTLSVTGTCNVATAIFTIDVRPRPTLTPASVNICSGSPSQLISVVAPEASTDYLWSPASDLYLDAAFTIPYTLGTPALQVYTVPFGTVTYSVTATNTVSGCTTGATTVLVSVCPALTNAICDADLVSAITAGTTATFTQYSLTGATASGGVPCAAIARDIYYRVIVPSNGEIHVVTQPGTNAVANLNVQSSLVSIHYGGGTCTTSPSVACNSGGASGSHSYVHYSGMTPGQTAYIRIASTTAGNTPSATYIKVAVTSGLVWTAAANDNFNNPANWHGGDATALTVPDATISAVIPSTVTKPRLASANGNVRGITFTTTAPYYTSPGIDLNGFTLNVKGSWAVGPIATSTTVLTCNGIVEFNGTIAQNISGKTTFGNVNFNNTALAVNVTSPTGVTCILKTVAGSVNSGGNLTLRSTATGTALVDPGLSGGFITGNVSVERKIGATSGYHYLSSPVSGAFVNNTTSGWRDDFTINAAVDNLVYVPGMPPAANFPTVWEYDETVVNVNASYGFIGATGTTDPITPLKGFACIVPGNTVVDVLGPVNNGNIPYSVTKTDNGFNLIGNPYPSPISWNAFRLSNPNLSATYMAFVTTGSYAGNYGTYDAVSAVGTLGVGNIISSSQAFYATAVSSGAIQAANTHRTLDLNPSFYNSPAVPNLIKVEVSEGGFADQTVVYFDANETDNYNAARDGLKMLAAPGTVASIYTTAGNKDLAINVMGSFNQDKLIPLGIMAAHNGNHTISVTDLTTFDPTAMIYLIDNVTGSTINLRSQNSYTANLTAGNVNNRFFIRFTPSITITPVAASCAGSDGKLNVVYPSTSLVSVTVVKQDGTIAASLNNFNGIGTIQNLSPANYRLDVTYTDGYTASTFATVDAGVGPDLVIAASQNSTAVNELISFTATSPATNIQWNFGDGTSMVSGTNVSHTFNAQGNYTVTATANDAQCNAMQQVNVHVSQATAIATNQADGYLWKFNNNQLTLQLNGDVISNGTIEIFDATGNIIATKATGKAKGSYTIDLGTASEGLYFAKFSNGQNTLMKKFVINGN